MFDGGYNLFIKPSPVKVSILTLEASLDITQVPLRRVRVKVTSGDITDGAASSLYEGSS